MCDGSLVLDRSVPDFVARPGSMLLTASSIELWSTTEQEISNKDLNKKKHAHQSAQMFIFEQKIVSMATNRKKVKYKIHLYKSFFTRVVIFLFITHMDHPPSITKHVPEIDEWVMSEKISDYVLQEAMENFVFPDEIKTKLMKILLWTLFHDS